MILDQLAAASRLRVEEAKRIRPLAQIKAEAIAAGNDGKYPFLRALKKPGISFICEVKKASPSKGVIADTFPYLDIARQYEDAGAAAISVLTEPKYFLGSDTYLKEIAASRAIPVLRKDFTVDAYQIYEARLLGAAAVLLICAILTKEQLAQYLGIADTLGLSAIVEAHDEAEIAMALDAGADIIGVNNRNLKDFTVDIDNSIRLRRLVPEDKVFISESGIRDADHVKRLYDNGTDAVLIGETLMRSADKKQMLRTLAGRIQVR